MRETLKVVGHVHRRPIRRVKNRKIINSIKKGKRRAKKTC